MLGARGIHACHCDVSDLQIHLGLPSSMQVLREVQLAEAVRKLGGLGARVAEAGINLSVGQRQLLCLGRALLAEVGCTPGRLLHLENAA